MGQDCQPERQRGVADTEFEMASGGVRGETRARNWYPADSRRFPRGTRRSQPEGVSHMAGSVKDMLAAANAVVPRLTPAEAAQMMRSGHVLIVDVRDPTEVQQSGRLQGAKTVSRGMLEFRADPDGPYHDTAFRKDETILLHCASGGRSALAGKTLMDMGYTKVFNIGGFKELKEAGIPTEPA
jgi:rhodanese-related sulfurtransferase